MNLNREKRYREAVKVLITNSEDSIMDKMLLSDSQLFNGFRVIYSTSRLEIRHEENSFGLDEILESNSLLTTVFSETGLVFHDDRIKAEVQFKKDSKILVNLCLNFDFNFVKSIYRWIDGQEKLDDPTEFIKLIALTKHPKSKLNTQPLFYLFEEIGNLPDLNNTRPFNYIRALILFDGIQYGEVCNCISNEIIRPTFKPELLEAAGKKACEIIDYFTKQKDFSLFNYERKALKLILMEAIHLKWSNNENASESFLKLVKFCLYKLGKIAKVELYYGWKYLKHSSKYDFFSFVLPREKVSEKAAWKIIRGINGMSWDLYFIRYQAQIIGTRIDGCDFTIPLFASHDNKLRQIIETCPIKCMIYDIEQGRYDLIREDEVSYLIDFANDIPEDLRQEIEDPRKSSNRANENLNNNSIDQALYDLESKLIELFQKAV